MNQIIGFDSRKFNRVMAMLVALTIVFGMVVVVGVQPAQAATWNLVWNDEFDTVAVDTTKWDFDLGNGFYGADGTFNAGWGNNEKEYYTNRPQNVSVAGGFLNITALKESYQGSEYTSARLITKNKLNKKFGRFEIKAKLPKGQGLWPALWFMPAKPETYGTWAACGEIDMLENIGSQPDRFFGTLHYGKAWPSNQSSGKTYIFPSGQDVTQWHTYALEWEPGEIRWYIDGNLYQTQNNWFSRGANTAANFAYPAPFDQEFYLIMNLAVGGNLPGDPDPNLTFPQTMQVDYVRVYDKAEGYGTAVQPTIPADPWPAGGKAALADGNFIYNNNFNQNVAGVDSIDGVNNSSYWLFQHKAEFKGDGNVQIQPIDGKNYARVNITSAGAAPYAIQLVQTATLVKGKYYRASFDAKSSEDKPLQVKIAGDLSRSYVNYAEVQDIGLTDTMKHYEFTFQMTSDTDLKARFEFNVGGNTKPAWIGNVRIEEIAAPTYNDNGVKEPLPNGNVVYNGTFDQGRADRMTFWSLATSGATATAAVDEAAKELKVGVTSAGTTAKAITVTQKGVKVGANSEYLLTFNGRASQARTIKVEVLSKDGTVSYSGVKTINLTTTAAQQTVGFFMANNTDPEAQLVFELGGAAGDVYLDDVSMTGNYSGINYAYVDQNPIKNGSFSSGFDNWSKYIHNDWANAQISVVNGEAKVAITHQGGQIWSVLVSNDKLNIPKDVEYVLSFDARSTIAREIEITAENANYARYFYQKVNLTNSMTRYSFPLKMTATDSVALKFLMGLPTGGTQLGNHEIYLDNVSLTVKDLNYQLSAVNNGKFTYDNVKWTPTFDSTKSASGSASVVNGEMKMAITNEGTDNTSTKLAQTGLALENGKKYRLTFNARATKNRNIRAMVVNSTTPTTKYLDNLFALTPTTQTYTIDFRMPYQNIPSSDFMFALGKIDGAAALGAHDVYIDNVTLTPLTMTPPAVVAGTELVSDGQFAGGVGAWKSWWGDEWNGISTGTLAAASGELKTGITSMANSAYIPVVYREGINLQAGAKYLVSFKARASTARKIRVNVGQDDTNWPWLQYYSSTKTFNLSTETETYYFWFTVTEPSYGNCKIMFELGNQFGETTPANDVYIDDVSIAKAQ